MLMVLYGQYVASRCPSYQNQQGCTMVPDQRDPICCLTPLCPNNAGVFGTINGSGTPAPPVTNPPITGMIDGWFIQFFPRMSESIKKQYMAKNMA